ncbi:hypothetical protein MZ16F89_22700 [Escherichia coli]
MAEWEKMKQMSLIEMDGFLKGKCIPRDLKVNETNAEYLVRKFGELESKLETALRECRSAGITIDNLEAKCAALVAESAGLKSGAMDEIKVINRGGQAYCVKDGVQVNPMYARGWNDYRAKSLQSDTPATDAFLAEVRAQGVEMYADNLDNGADDAERGGFDYAVKFLRSEASGVRLFADQLRKGGGQ